MTVPADRVPATVRSLGWTSFLTDLSSEAIYPLLPAFVKGLGGSAVDVGLLDGLANAVAAIVRLFAGGLSDRVGRRPLVLVGYGLSAVVRPLMGLVATPLGAVLVRTTDRFGKGIRSAPRDALVTDLVEPGARGRAFGHIRAMDHAGAAIGPVLAMAFLLAFPGRERSLFLLTAVPGLLTLLVIWWHVREAPARGRTLPSAGPARLSRSQAVLLASVAVWGLGASSEQFLLMRAAELGVPAALVPIVWFGMGVMKSVSAANAGRIVDFTTPRVALAAGWLGFAAAYAGLATFSHLAAVLPLVACVGIALGLAEPAERALVAALAADGRQGNAFGWYALVQGILSLPAGLVAGSLWDRGPEGPALAFGLTAILSAAACGLVLLVPRSRSTGG